jgi:hypothetical protein
MYIHAISLGGKVADFMISKITGVQETSPSYHYGLSIKFQENSCRFVGSALLSHTVALWPHHGLFCS